MPVLIQSGIQLLSLYIVLSSWNCYYSWVYVFISGVWDCSVCMMSEGAFFFPVSLFSPPPSFFLKISKKYKCCNCSGKKPNQMKHNLQSGKTDSPASSNCCFVLSRCKCLFLLYCWLSLLFSDNTSIPGYECTNTR